MVVTNAASQMTEAMAVRYGERRTSVEARPESAFGAFAAGLFALGRCAAGATGQTLHTIDGRGDQRRRDPQQRALGAEALDDLPRRQAADDPAENRAAADQAERALRLARGQHVVGQRPDLRRAPAR